MPSHLVDSVEVSMPFHRLICKRSHQIAASAKQDSYIHTDYRAYAGRKDSAAGSREVPRLGSPRIAIAIGKVS